MSSDSSESKKPDQVSKVKPLPRRVQKLQSSDESDERQNSQGSKTSQKSVKQTYHPKVTVLEELSLKPVVSAYKDELPKGTATTVNSTPPTVITAVLKDLRDDIVRIPDYRQPGPMTLVNGDRAIAVIGGDNIYVQNKTKFIPVPREKILTAPNLWPYSSKVAEDSSLDVAILVQKIFTPLSSICFGLLGGVALLQLILVHHLMGDGSEEEVRFFLQSYSLFAQIAPLLFYVLLAICIVSMLDRVTVEQDPWVFRPSWIVVGMYVLTLVANFSCASYDDMLTMYRQNKTIFEDRMKTQEVMSEWQALNTARCLFALLGWLLFSLSSPNDLLLEHLQNIRQFQQEKLPTSIGVQ
ncbi:uncharacterized protein LOC128992705 [Macrosteles quadrilineatus]|uniref:uncharacterized protein LOC128992705 n=1 Tax=Macrosteles quadrilineatus TaxID=74068 RepID=UPI0023E1EC5F|nr:uncharacterized protein LOC128992705 [Macrosteles quadrilineatus]